MDKSLAGIVLAAGSGTRLRPLTDELPKALCPVGGVPLVDLALARLAAAGLAGPGSVAVNAHHRADLLAGHLDGVVHLSVEERLLGTGGGVGRLRSWVAGRAVLLVNADTVHDASLDLLLDGWDGERLRFLAAATVAPARIDRVVRLCGALMPWAAIDGLRDEPAGISECVWKPWQRAGRVEIVAAVARFLDCGTPARYLAANLWTSGGRTVLGDGAVLDGFAERCVLWPRARVGRGEVLRDAIRTTAGRTVAVRAITRGGLEPPEAAFAVL
jgi:mannose-1-phosphate guanylyltransferase/MurNAc alpha-1-phosphate uridylyltransferase